MKSEPQPALSLTGKLEAPSGDATYEKILDAGLARFTEFGLRRTTMEDVAGKAGVGRATAYRRFGDKDQLIQAVILRECQRHLGEIEQHLKSIDSPVDALLEAFVLAVTRAHAHPLLVRLLSSEPETILPYLTVRWGRLMALFRSHLTAQIEKAQQAGGLKKRPADQVAELFLRLMQSLVLTPEGVVNPGDEASVRRFAENYFRPLLAP